MSYRSVLFRQKAYSRKPEFSHPHTEDQRGRSLHACNFFFKECPPQHVTVFTRIRRPKTPLGNIYFKLVLKVVILSINLLSNCFFLSSKRKSIWPSVFVVLKRSVINSVCRVWHICLPTTRLSSVCVLAAYGIGLLITFVALAVMQKGQPALLYLVPCTLLTSLTVALCRRELPQFWTGSGFVVNTSLIWPPTAEEQKKDLNKKTTKKKSRVK